MRGKTIELGGITYNYVERQLTEELSSWKDIKGREVKRIGIRNEISIVKYHPSNEEIDNLYKIPKKEPILIYGVNYYLCDIECNIEKVEITLLSTEYTGIEEFLYL